MLILCNVKNEDKVNSPVFLKISIKGNETGNLIFFGMVVLGATKRFYAPVFYLFRNSMSKSKVKVQKLCLWWTDDEWMIDIIICIYDCRHSHDSSILLKVRTWNSFLKKRNKLAKLSTPQNLFYSLLLFYSARTQNTLEYLIILVWSSSNFLWW